MRKALGFALAVAVLGGGTVFVSSIPQAAADPADGTLKVHVIRDINGNGSYDAALEVGVGGIGVTVTAPTGATATGATAADGTVSIDTKALPSGQYRVDTKIPDSMSYLKPAPAGKGLSSLTAFADVSGGKAVELTVGVWNPSDYCQDNPALVTGCQRNGISPGVDNAARSLVSLPFDARGTAPAASKLAEQGDTGTVYGIAYRKQDKRIFSGAFAKRAAAYGSGGAGAVYVTDSDANTTKVFTKVPDPGTGAHDMEAGADSAFADVVGREALGDIDISEDGSTLYVVNLADRKLYLYDATAATANAPKASYAIPNPNCPAAGDWRPGALGVRDGLVYVGGVCSGESTQNAADMRVVVREFDQAAGTFGAPVIDQKLDFQRGTVLWQGSGTDRWKPWQGKFKQPAPTGGLVENPEPLLTDVGIEANGDLVLAFRDRFGDQGGKSMPPADGSPGLFDTVSGGDLNRACRQADGKFSWEGTGSCPNNNSGANNGNGQESSVVEYYPGEHYGTPDSKPHNETAQGALATVYSATRMPATVMDPLALNTGGLGWFDRVEGTMDAEGHPNGYQLDDVASAGWGKANGLADLEALCDLAPVQIGNRIWFDTDSDGIQDGDEPPVPGVKVQLLACADGAVVATTTTDAQGEYYFGTADGLKADTCYNVKFDYAAADTSKLPGAPPPATLTWTGKEAGADRCLDSSVDPATSQVAVTVGKAGSVDHCIDGGLTVKQTNKLGDFVWIDKNANGLQDLDELGVPGVKVTLKDGAGAEKGSTTTDAGGKYLFDKVPDGAYQVCFDMAALPDAVKGYSLTKVDAGDDTKDSDADVATGCTKVTTLGPDKREDLTLDAGLITPLNKLGDFVWIDKNANGLQDSGEPGVQDVKATLKDGTGATKGTTTTDAGGKYLFDKVPDGTYQVCFDIAALPEAVKGYTLTKVDAGDDTKDSDAAFDTGCTKTTLLGADKREDLTLDAGLITPLVPLNKLGDFVWIDKNANGLQDPDELGVPGVKVTLKDGAGAAKGVATTGSDGKYLFDKVPDGTYQVCFDIAALPDAVKGYTLTKVDAGDDTKDSDADLATGCTKTTTLGPDKREDLTLDAGLVAPPVGAFKLGDYVWIDKNKDGVQDQDEPGVPGMGVTVKDDTGKEIGSTKTGPDGKYLFEQLPAGDYSVCFGIADMPEAVKGYVLTKADAGDDGKDSDADATTGCTKPVKLGPDNLTVDAGLIEPEKPVFKVGDFVWVDTNRNGLQDGGEPGVKGFTVVLKGPDGENKTTTDADGKYVFGNLPAGDYSVCFDLADMPEAVKGYVLTKADAGDDGKDSDADATTGCTKPVKLGPDNLTLDAGLVAPVKPESNKVGDFVWNDVNANGIQDPGEPGVPGVGVVLKGKDGVEVSTTTTGPDGKYLFPQVPDGTYTVCFDTRNLPEAVKDYLPTATGKGDAGKDSDADPATGCAKPTTVGPKKREDLTIDLGLVKVTNRVGDYVWFDQNDNGIQDPGEHGVKDVTVVLKDAEGKEIAKSVTDLDGKYLFKGLPDGTYLVCFDVANLPGDYQGNGLTVPNKGEAGKNSAADQASGCTKTVKLGPDKREDLTLDAGLRGNRENPQAPAKPDNQGTSSNPKGPLAKTGFSAVLPLGISSLLLLTGIGLLVVVRRRREEE